MHSILRSRIFNVLKPCQLIATKQAAKNTWPNFLLISLTSPVVQLLASSRRELIFQDMLFNAKELIRLFLCLFEKLSILFVNIRNS